MPLVDDTSKKGTGANISELIKSGYERRQAVAIALSHRRQVIKKGSTGGKKHDKPHR